MSDTAVKKHHREPLIHIVKRDDLSGGKAWAIRGAAIVLSLLLIGVLSVLLTGESFVEIYNKMFLGTFGRIFEGRTQSGSPPTLWCDLITADFPRPLSITSG